MFNPRDMQSVVRDISEQKERLLLEQLGELVSRGLLVMEEGETSLFQDPSQPPGTGLQLRSTVRLVLKDKEYIAQLEQKVQDLEKRLEAVAVAVEPVLNRVGRR